MINAAANGLPVDMSKLPALPGEKEVDFEFLKAEDCEVPEDLQSDDPKVRPLLVLRRIFRSSLLYLFSTAPMFS